jgi:adenylyltransferase/sulfurtransferase
MKNDRYSRQRVLEEIGPAGQEKLLQASVLIVGCGALGCLQAQLLARAGLGRICIVDRDVVEENNLQRQLLFDEEDAAAGLPKAEAAARKLRKVNSTIEISGLVKDVTPRNIGGLMDGNAVVLDGTDNLETRYLINDACVKSKKPWIYGGVIGTTGLTFSILPGRGPCLRCVFPNPPPPGSLPTCETAGVLSTAPATVASFQVTEAIKLVAGDHSSKPLMHYFDLWRGFFTSVTLHRDEECPCCKKGSYDYLQARETSLAVTLCGRNAVQISPPRDFNLSLEILYERLRRTGKVSYNGLLLQFEVGDHELVVFPDGRALVKGTAEAALARSLYAKYVSG